MIASKLRLIVTKSASPIWRIKVGLLDVAPPIWRRFDTFSDVTLFQLHHYIQGAMGWDLAHLYAFGDGRGYGEQYSNTLRLCDVCRVGDGLTYTYDFGDQWEHLVIVEKSMTRTTGSYPRMVAGNRACPPEDCGGSWGYADMLRVLAGPRNARRREVVEWVGKSFDPKVLDFEEAQIRLAEYAALAQPKTVN